MKRTFSFISAFLSLIMLLTVTAFAQSKDLKQALKKIKKEGCIYGLFMQNLPIRLVRINRFDNKIGKKPGMIMFFINWESCVAFPPGAAQQSRTKSFSVRFSIPTGICEAAPWI